MNAAMHTARTSATPDPVDEGLALSELLEELLEAVDDLGEFAQACEHDAFLARCKGEGDGVTLNADECAYLLACCRTIARAAVALALAGEEAGP